MEGLTKRFGGLTTLDLMSFDIYEGEILGFIGPNGASKSTTFNCICGTFAPTIGTVRIKSQDVTGLATHKMVERGVARTFQTFRSLRDHDVLSNVELPSVDDSLVTLSGLFRRTESVAAEICRRGGLGDEMEKYLDELSHADMICLELARALAMDPDFLLVDVPFAGLSMQEVQDLSALFEDPSRASSTWLTDVSSSTSAG